MTFKLRNADDFEFPVEVEVPGAQGHEIETFTGRFKRMPENKVAELFRGNGKDEVSDRQIAEQVLIGWGEDMVGEDGKPVPFNAKTKKQALAMPEVTRAVVMAFGHAMVGRSYVRKN